jgi:hypothetical protein
MKSWVKVLALSGMPSDTVPLNIPFKQGGALPGLVVLHGCCSLWVVMSLYRNRQRFDAVDASGTHWARSAHSLQLRCRSISHTLESPAFVSADVGCCSVLWCAPVQVDDACAGTLVVAGPGPSHMGRCTPVSAVVLA